MPFMRACRYEMHGDTSDKRCAGPTPWKLQNVAETEELNGWWGMSVDVSGNSVLLRCQLSVNSSTDLMQSQ